MITKGTLTGKTSGLWVFIPELKATYGPLPYVGHGGDYYIGNQVLVAGVGADEYVVIGTIRP